MSPLFVGIDLGTTGTKATLVDSEIGVIASATASSPLWSDHPGWSEADTTVWWRNVGTVVRELFDASGIAPTDIAGVACSGMVPAVVFLDSLLRPLRRAILQNDARAVAEIPELAIELADIGFDHLGVTGSALTQQSVAPTWRWILCNEPDVARDAAHIVGSYDWLAMMLGAEPHVETNWALESGMYTTGLSRVAAVLDVAEIPTTICPPVRAPGTRVGEVSALGAEGSGLAVGTPIFVGGADHVLAAYAAGLANGGDWLIKLGGAGDILVVSETAAIDQRWYLDAHPAPELWLPNGCMATSGSLLRWVQALVGGTELAVLDREADQSLPASIICLPYFLGEKSPFHDPDLRGAFVGLHLGHGRGDLFRACLEAIAYGFRDHVEAFKSRNVGLASSARVSNGGSGSIIWKQILADVLSIELLPVIDSGGAALGAALVAAVGGGALTSWTESERFVALGAPITPQSELSEAYEEGYAMFQTLQSRLTPIAHQLAARGRQ